jgi:molybdopterin-guanine dinucleotide biosynthesis protein
MDDFKTLTMNKKTVVAGPGGATKAVPKSMIWLGDERRKEYVGGMHFRPDKAEEFMTVGGLAYNMWRGWSYTPQKGSWAKLKRHILEIVCRGDEGHYTWLLDWMADLYQDPYNPKGCAVVMKGIEGSGKGTLIEAIGRTMGRHYKHLTQEEHLTGRFTGHLQDGLLVFADEVVYGGSKKHAGTLKALVSERNLTVERKGVDAYRYYNCAHLAVASNEDWFIPAGPESRRWFVLETSSDRAKDMNWFNEIHKEMDNGGTEAMMHELMGREITSNLKRAPETKMLADQRLRYAASHRDSFTTWMQDCLESGVLGVQCHKSNDIETAWPVLVDRMELYTAYEQWCGLKRLPVNEIAHKSLFYSRAERMGLKKVRPAMADGQRRWMYEISPLETTIAVFEQLHSVEI